MIFNNGMVSVDEHFVRVGSKSYAVDKIGSIDVRNRFIKGSSGYIIAWVVAAVTAVLAIVHRSEGYAVFALIVAIAGLPSFRKRHSQTFFSLVLLTNAGETQAFESTDSEEIMDIRDAIERAMIRR
jgi:hypothetical protein